MTDDRNAWRPATIAAQAAGQEDASGAVVGPIHTATTFLRDPDYALPESGDIYRRPNNATVREAEAVIAALEGAAEARLFASGLAAIGAVMRCADGPIVVQDQLYYGTAKLTQLYAREGRTIATVPTGDIAALKAACRRHRAALAVIETPSNPFLHVTDIAAAADAAHAAGTLLAVDSTAATPIVTQPLALGADIVMHSATKALNGHSDVLAGALAVRDRSLPHWRRIDELRGMEGAVASPFDAYLLTRGMRTLPLRIAETNRSALHIAHHLSAHPNVTAVRYPGLASHPAHALAARQMAGFGHLMSFDVKGGAREALAVCGALRIVKRATSLGGVESLIEHRHSIEPAFTGIPPALLRLSVGIEAVEDLVGDLAQALDTLG